MYLLFVGAFELFNLLHVVALMRWHMHAHTYTEPCIRDVNPRVFHLSADNLQGTFTVCLQCSCQLQVSFHIYFCRHIPLTYQYLSPS